MIRSPGMWQFSKYSSVVGDPFIPIIRSLGPTLNPSSSVCTMNADMPLAPSSAHWDVCGLCVLQQHGEGDCVLDRLVGPLSQVRCHRVVGRPGLQRWTVVDVGHHRIGRRDDGCRGPRSQRPDVTEPHWCISIFLDFMARFVLGHCWVCLARASPAAASWGGPRGRADDVPDPEHQQGGAPADQQLARPAPQGTAAVERADCRAHAEQGQAGRHDRDDQSGPAGAER